MNGLSSKSNFLELEHERKPARVGVCCELQNSRRLNCGVAICAEVNARGGGADVAAGQTPARQVRSLQTVINLGWMSERSTNANLAPFVAKDDGRLAIRRIGQH